jgi:hypothetical protein
MFLIDLEPFLEDLNNLGTYLNWFDTNL